MNADARTPRNAQVAYDAAHERTTKLLADVARLVEAHRTRATQGGEIKNWGMAGDLGMVNSRLLEVAAFLAGENH